MRKQPRVQVRYSEAFKEQVLSEIESGKYSIYEARRLYNINGGATIQNWAKKRGILGIFPKQVRVEKPNETSRLKALEVENRQLKEALAEAVLDKKIAESTLEVICEQRGWDVEEIKKKAGSKSQQRLSVNKRK